MGEQRTAPGYYMGYFVQWFKILVYIECQPVWQLVLPPPLSASPSKAFSPHIPHSMVILSSSDSSPPPYILIYSLVTFPSCQLPSPSMFPSSAAAHLLYFSSRHFFIVFTCKASPRSSFVSPFHCTDTRFRLFCPFLNSLSSPETLSSSLHPSYRMLLPFTSSPSPPSHPTHSSFPPTSSIFSPSPSIVVPGNEWVTWICLFTLQPLPSAAQEHLWKNQ